MTYQLRYLFWTATLAVSLGGITACQQKKANHDTPAQTIRKGKPVKAIEKTRQVRHAKRAIPKSVADPKLREPFAAQIVELKGTSATSRASRIDEVEEAKTGGRLFGGGWLDTGAEGQATLPIRSLGTATLFPRSTLVVPEYQRCGVLLAKGIMTIIGPPPDTEFKSCYLHTPSASIRIPSGNRGSITISARGDTWIEAQKGPLYYINLENESVEVEEGYEVVLGTAVKAETKRPTLLDKRKQAKKKEKWLAARELRKRDEPVFLDETLTRAFDLILSLEQNVARLIALKEKNREISVRLKNGKNKSDESAKGLKQQLIGQAREMIELKDRSTLLTLRILAIREFALSIIDDSKNQVTRIANINERLAKMAVDLPELFDRPQAKPPKNDFR